MTILTAAHCIGDAATGEFRTGSVPIQILCTKFPDWQELWPATITSYDIALCRADKTIPRDASADERYERVDTSPTALPLNTAVTLLGYGCTATEPSFKVFAQGQSTTESNDFGAYVRTKAGKQNAEFCSGDSGGGVYREELGSKRQIVGIASHGDGSKSWITKLSDPHVKKFINDWAASKNLFE